MKKAIRLIIFFCITFIISGTQKLLSANNPFNADIVVALDGSGDYTKIQDAINATPSNSTRRTVIYIKRGLYNTEKLIVPADKKNITIIGESRDETIMSYHIYDCTDGKCPTADAALWTGDVIRTSATLTIYGDGFRAENLTIQNTAGPVGQALAITVCSDKTVFVNCNILGYQDTIYLWTEGKRSFFENCLVVGRTDYIYGSGIGYFLACEIRSWGGGWITAPSTPQAQVYGFVFYQCQITYALNSPRSGDDGATVGLGRPWHNYPKVAWLYCEMNEKINPLGWPTTWNMDYASSSSDLHLYEYKNTGPGADMSGRANWAGIRALTDTEALNYTVQKVFVDWDPTAEAPLLKTYKWAGKGANNGWLIAENWDTIGVPVIGEVAIVDSSFTIMADGGSFAADLIIKNGAKIDITANSSATYLSTAGCIIGTSNDITFNGKISTKDTNVFDISGTLALNATLYGVHNFYKNGTGKLVLSSDNSNYFGSWVILEGSIDAQAINSLGKGSVLVKSGGKLIINNKNCLQPNSQLKVLTGAQLECNNDITLSEFFIDGAMQTVGEYNTITHAGLISGTGKIIVGRPSVFNFIGGANGNWDNPSHFSPQLLPEAGETVIVETEMETTSWEFPANIILTSKGNIRLRGVHKCTGEIEMQTGSRLTYATSGSGFTLNAPINIVGDISLQMSSGNTSGSEMILPGNIEGNGKISVNNTRDFANIATVVLAGNNINFNGTWDLTQANRNADGIAAIDGISENASGRSVISSAGINKVVLSHAKCAGDTLNINLNGSSKIVLNTNVNIRHFILNEMVKDTGTYNSSSNPDIFEGVGNLIVSIDTVEDPGGDTITDPGTDPNDTTTNINKTRSEMIYFTKCFININYPSSKVSIYNLQGIEIMYFENKRQIFLGSIYPGIYIVKYEINGQAGNIKIAVTD